MTVSAINPGGGVVCACAALLLLLPPSGSAQVQRDVSIDRLVPVLDGAGFVGLTGTPTPGHMRWDVALWGGYLHRPLANGDIDLVCVSLRG